MGVVRSKYLSFFFVSIVMMLSVRAANCQWVQLANFDATIESIYFLESVNRPNIGFVGVGNDIFRTLDGGTTWTLVMRNLRGAPTGFAFKDGSTGWCSIGGIATSTAIYKTTDGGSSWSPLIVTGIGSDVSYDGTTGLLFLSLRQSNKNSLISADDGATWRTLNSEIEENGFAFCDPMHGVLTSLGNTYGTLDGGITWSGVPLALHSWSPCAIPGTSTFVAANDMGQIMYKSTDAGLTWISIPGIPGKDALTGCVQPGRCGVYAQTNTGIYESPTLNGWIFISGPGNTYDTRFFAGTKFVYAGDGAGNVQKLLQSGADWPSVQLNPISINLTEALGCPKKTALATFKNISCLPLNVLKAWIPDSVQWSLAPDSLPVTLNTDDTIQFHLTGLGKTAGTFKSTLELLIKTTAGTSDTALPLTITVQGIVPPTIKPVAVALRDKCTPLDTVFRIQNNHCDTVRITSLSMIDSTLFLIGTIALPIVLPPDSVCIVPVTAKPKAKGLFKDNVGVKITFGDFQMDTSVALTGAVPASIVAASFSDSLMAFGTVSGCQPKLDTIYLKNIACDSEQITSTQIGVGSAFKLLSNVLHTWFGPQDSVAIVVQLGSGASGNFTGELDILLDNGTYREEFPVPISGAVTHSSAVPSLNASAIVRDSVPPCATLDTAFAMSFTSDCPDSLRISSLKYSGNGSVIVTSAPPLPYELHNGDTLKYLVTYSPKASEVVNGNIEIQGTNFDTLLPLHFSVGSGGEAQLSISAARTTLSAKFCDKDSVYIQLKNTGCGPAIIDSLALQSLVKDQTQFTFAPTQFPFTIPPSGSSQIKVYYAGDGAGDGSANLFARESSGKTLTQPISGSTIPTASARVGIALLPSSTLNPVVGKTATPYLYFVDAVPSSSALQSINCNVAFNANVLSDLGPLGQNGWSVNELSSTQTGISLSITRTSANAIAAGDQIATLPLQAYISDTLSTPIALTALNFTPSDPNYERCTLAAKIAPPMLNVTINTQCGDSDLSAILRGDRIIISSVQIKPNPLSKNGASEMTISFISSEQALATVTISDVLGRTRATASSNATIGSNSIAIPAKTLDEGVYYVDLEEERTHVIKRFVVIGDR